MARTGENLYRPEYCQRIVEFFSLEGDKRPSVAKFAFSIDVTNATLLNWAKKYPEFAEAYDHARELEKEHIIDKALSQEYSPTFAKFLLSASFGMKETSEVGITGANGQPFAVNIKIID